MGGTRRGTRRVTQREAAEVLGVSVEAIRKRIKRGTLPSEKGEDGRRYVYLDEAPDAAHPQVEDEGSRALAEELRDQVLYLREQLRREQDAHAEARRIIAALTSRIPELEAPASSTAPESPQERPEEPAEGSTTPGPAEALRTDPERPWWRRVFGG